MPELILHHYDISPYAEKIRAILGFKGLSWRSVHIYHPLWALRANPASAAFFEPRPRVRAWLERIAGFGHGKPKEMEPQEAIAIARESRPTTEPAEDPTDPTGRRVGDRVQVFPEAYGRDPVAGELVFADPHEIAIRRRDERAGEVIVHFPKEGMVIL